jgi:hypothetical protein
MVDSDSSALALIDGALRDLGKTRIALDLVRELLDKSGPAPVPPLRNAAPELVEALRALLAVAIVSRDLYGDEHLARTDAIDKGLAVLAKAGGAP